MLGIIVSHVVRYNYAMEHCVYTCVNLNEVFWFTRIILYV